MTVNHDYTPYSYFPAGDMLPESIPWMFLADTDLTVVDVTGTVLVAGVDYEISGDGPAKAGIITTLRIFDAEDEITISRTTEMRQQLALPANQPVPSSQYERELDRRSLIEQEQDVATAALDARTVKVPDGEAAPDFASLSAIAEGDLLEYRDGKLKPFNHAPFAGKFYAGDAGGRPVPASGTEGADNALRADLAGVNGAGLSAFSHAGVYGPGTIGHNLKRVIYVTDAPYGAVGDGTDEFAKIASIASALDAANGGVIVFPMTAAGGVFGLSETIQIPENTTVSFLGGAVKLLGITTYDAAFIGVPGATNIRIHNPQIDCNNIRGSNGIIKRRNNPEFIVMGGLIKNCAHDAVGDPGNADVNLRAARFGGRAINIEAGVDPSAYGSRNAVVMGTIARDCFEALSVSGGATTQQESNIRVDMIAENCQSAISLFGNTAGYPHGPDEMGCHITMTARNCGKSTTYARAHGVINSDRGCNAKIDIQVMNDATYGAVGSLFRGDASNIILNGQMEGECSRALLDFASYQEVLAIDEDATWTASGNTLSSLDSQFTVKHTGTAADTIIVPIVSAAFLTNCQFDLTTDVVATLKPVNTNMANKTTCYGKFQNKTSNATIQGLLSNIGSTITFANMANTKWDADPGSLKARVVFNASTGAILGSYNVASITDNGVGDFDVNFIVPAPNANYTVGLNATVASTTSAQNDWADGKTTTKFRIRTYSGGGLVDKDTTEALVFW